MDALGNVTKSTYDADNNLLTKTDALGNVTTYEYDEDGNLSSMTTRRFLFLIKKKCRINAACGVSQTPILYNKKERENKSIDFI